MASRQCLRRVTEDRNVLWSYSVLSRNLTGRPVTFEALRSFRKGYSTKVRPAAPLALQNSLRYPHALSNCGAWTDWHCNRSRHESHQISLAHRRFYGQFPVNVDFSFKAWCFLSGDYCQGTRDGGIYKWGHAQAVAEGSVKGQLHLTKGIAKVVYRDRWLRGAGWGACYNRDRQGACFARALGRRFDWHSENSQIDVAVNAPSAGTIKEFLANEEDTVTVGQGILKLELGGEPQKEEKEEGGQEPKAPASKEQPTSSDPEPKKETSPPPPPPPKKEPEAPKQTEPKTEPKKEKEPAPSKTPEPKKTEGKKPETKATGSDASFGNREERRVGSSVSFTGSFAKMFSRSRWTGCVFALQNVWNNRKILQLH